MRWKRGNPKQKNYDLANQKVMMTISKQDKRIKREVG